MRCKYLHVMPAIHARIYPTIKFFKVSFDKEDHVFLIMGDRDFIISRNPRLLAFTDLCYTPNIDHHNYSKLKRLAFLINKFKNAEHIVFHSLFSVKGMALPLLLTSKKLWRKTAWIEWGQDMYDWTMPSNGLPSKLRNYVHKRIRKNLGPVGLTIASNEEEYRRQFKNDIKCFETPIPISPISMTMLERARQYQGTKVKPIVLVIDDEFNPDGHMPVIDSMSRFSDKDFSIILMMGYWIRCRPARRSKKEYWHIAGEYVKSIMGREPTAINWGSPTKDGHYKFLWGIDVAIFDGERPAEHDLLLYLLYMGKKVYLPGDTPLYKYLKQKGVCVFDANQLKEISFEEFIAPVEENVSTDWIKERMDQKAIAQQWEQLFNYMEQNAAAQ